MAIVLCKFTRRGSDLSVISFSHAMLSADFRAIGQTLQLGEVDDDLLGYDNLSLHDHVLLNSVFYISEHM